MTTLSTFPLFKEKLLSLIGELKVASRKNQHSLAKFLCLLLIRALAAPEAKRFSYTLSLERNTKAVLLDQFSSNADLEHPIHQIKSHIEFYFDHCGSFTMWEKASLVTCDFLVNYYEKKILHTTMVKTLFNTMTAKAKNETRAERSKLTKKK
jgi:hypothetical protein